MEWIANSRLFKLASSGKRLTHIIPVTLLCFIFAKVSHFGAIPVYLIERNTYGFSGKYLFELLPSFESGYYMTIYLIASFLFFYVFVWVWIKLYEKRSFFTLGFEYKDALKHYFRGFIIGILMFLATLLVLALFGTVKVGYSLNYQMGIYALSGVFVVLIGWIVQGGAEEVLVRGWVLPVIGARYKPWLGLIISSSLFSLLHCFNSYLSILAVINLTLFGFFAGLYAIYEGSLWGICALHSAWNWVQGNIFGFEVSGSLVGGGSILKLVEDGPDWFTGGRFGPEGGIAVTIVLLFGILSIVVIGKNRDLSLKSI